MYNQAEVVIPTRSADIKEIFFKQIKMSIVICTFSQSMNAYNFSYIALLKNFNNNVKNM